MKQQYTWLLALVVAITGCTKLDQFPESSASKEAVFGSEKGLELYANSFYDVLPDANTVHRGDEMSDYGARTQAPDFLREGAYGPRQSSGWDWKPLRNINYFIENCTDPDVPQDVRTHYIAVARFFRAIFYFEKVKRFGDVPWITRTMEVEDPALFNGRDPRGTVMDSVLVDLDFACQNIKTTSDNTRSLITKYVAFGFKSRICLFEGTFRKYHAGGLAKGLEGTIDKWLQEAASASDEVMKNGGFTLYTGAGLDKSYRQLFINKAPVGAEVMLANVCDPALSVYNDANWYWTSATYGARLSFTRAFVNTYLNTDGTPFTSQPGYETKTFLEETKNRDLRLQQTIRLGDYKRINKDAAIPAPPVFSYTYTGYQPIKWCLDDVFFDDAGGKNDNSICMMRFAEILLNFAEAKAELGTLTADDWTKTIGALRQRAGITNGTGTLPAVADPYMVQYFNNLITNPVLLEIRRERGIELAWEGLRFPDIIRWKAGSLMTRTWNGFYVPALDTPMDLNGDGRMDVLFHGKDKPAPINGVTFINVAETLSGGVVNPQRLTQGTRGELTWLSNISRKWEDKNYLYPIPEADRLMNPKLGQNPGWEQ